MIDDELRPRSNPAFQGPSRGSGELSALIESRIAPLTIATLAKTAAVLLFTPKLEGPDHLLNDRVHRLSRVFPAKRRSGGRI